MSIDFNGLSQNSLNKTRTADSNKAQTAKSGSAPPPSQENATKSGSEAKADVELSSTGKLLHKLEEKIGQTPDIDEEKVASIKAAISDGSYSIDSKSLAHNILLSDNS